MEPRFGYDFSRVRVHADSRAAKSAEAVNAQAYTVGSNIVFGANQGGAKNLSHQRLLAHELAHVVQQDGRRSGGSLQVAPAKDSAEGAADRAADQVLSGGRVADFTGHRPLAHESTDATQHQAGSATTLQRQPKETPVQGPGKCDPKQLSSLGTQYHMTVDDTKADKQKQGLKEMHLGKASAENKDFVLFCPHIPSARLKSLVPCTSVFVIGSNRPPGKVDVWAQQPGETEMFWGFVNESLLSGDLPDDCIRTGTTTLKHATPKAPPPPPPAFDDTVVWQYVGSALAKNDSIYWKAYKYLHDLRNAPHSFAGDPDLCSDPSLAAAEHYLFARSLVRDWEFPSAFVEGMVLGYGPTKDKLREMGLDIQLGRCPTTPNSLEQTKFGLFGAAEGSVFNKENLSYVPFGVPPSQWLMEKPLDWLKHL